MVNVVRVPVEEGKPVRYLPSKSTVAPALPTPLNVKIPLLVLKEALLI